MREKNKERITLIQQQMTFAKNYMILSKSLENKKQIYHENLLMAQEENHALNKDLCRLLQENKNLVKEIESIKEKTTETKTDNKLLCTREYELMTTIINSDKESRDLTEALNRSSEIIKKKQMEYAQVCEKLKSLLKIKEDIISSNQIKKTNLMRKVFKARKYNEENNIVSQATNLLTSNLIKGVRKFTFDEALTFSEIFDRLKIFYVRQKEKLETLIKQSEENKKFQEKKKEVVRPNMIKFFSHISCSYEDIQLNLNPEDFDNCTVINDRLLNLHKLLKNKKSIINSQYEQAQQEFSGFKAEIKVQNSQLIEYMKNKKNRMSLKKSWNILKSFMKVRKERREREHKEKLAEHENQQRLQREKLERDRLDRAEKERQEKEKLERAEKERQERERLEKDKENLRKEKERELLDYDTGFQNIQITQNEIPYENKKTRRGASRDVKQKEPRRSKRNFANTKETNNISTSLQQNHSNNIASTTSSYSNLSQIAQPQNKHNLKVDLLKIEESFNKNSTINSSNDNFLDEISKNIHEISEFPTKNTFGDKKKRYMSSFNFI
jgi:hypothetical protein